MMQMHSKFWAGILIALMGGVGLSSAAQNSAPLSKSQPSAPANSATPGALYVCLPTNDGFLRARLWGSIRADIAWSDAGLECSGATRPAGGIRLRFSHPFEDEAAPKVKRLVFVFGIPNLREGVNAKDLPVNVTVIREGAGQFYGTQGDNKCRIDDMQQEPIAGIPLRNRSYRVVVRGFCTQPAREVQGDGVLHITRFDFAGRVDYSEEDRSPDTPTLAQKPN